jgi:glycosyltransferase involved in cell wall biosynthesis
MKIAFLTPEYPHTKCNHSAGIGTSIYNLSRALLEIGCKVQVLIYGQDIDEVFEDHGITIQKIKNIKVKGLSRWLTQKKIENLINKLYSQNKIDLVESIDWGGITSFIQPNKCPIIIKLHGSDTYFCHLDGRQVKWINKFHEKRALKKADAHSSVSHFTAKTTNQVFDLDIDFKIIPNSINVEVFHPLPIPQNKIKRVLYLGTLIRKKGLLEIPMIFNKVVESYDTVELILIGGDSYDIKTNTSSTYQLMKPLFSEKAIRKQTYLGKVPYDEVKNHIAEADVVVYPSFAEALPVSWLEAMAMEKTIVASNVGWASEIINHGVDGFMENPENHGEYAGLILNVLRGEIDTEKLGKNARKKIKAKFSNEIIAKQNIEFYQKVIDESK